MEHRESSALSRELGAELRKAREKAGYVGYQLANRLGWSASKVSRAETGLQPPSEVDTAIFLSYCHAERDEIKYLMGVARELSDAYHLRPHGSGLPDELRTLIIQETTADVITEFEVTRIPGLLQTDDYARALFMAGVVPPKEIGARVQARVDRQSLLARPKPDITFFIHESALRTPVGSNRVMHEQCLKLLFDVHRHGSVIRVIPIEHGAHAGMSGAFRIMQVTGYNPVVYVETQTVSLFLEKVSEVTTYLRMVDKLALAALDEGQSRELIAQLASDYDRPEGSMTWPALGAPVPTAATTGTVFRSPSPPPTP
ncbi:helix-turn-helix domain-containing protein [Labedaea rhizosphaerae]|uniref:helix-turn-helix domain-containing protein n=1 Tax=Labedaea rhizosphaerae TaxID=598644 RepID=UPI001414E6C6|nr:helix-turn-helix transcriptional regulator [Labedaea rhizosphaerae]